MAGALEELGGEGRSQGVENVAEDVLQRALLVELGHQLGQGLNSGATDITPEQQARLESVIDGLLTTAAKRTGNGLRRDVSPELRQMVQQDIVAAFAEGVRGELGGSLEETVDRVVTRAVLSLRRGIEDEQMQQAIADLVRASVYEALRESKDEKRPAVGEVVETTLSENVFAPMQGTVSGLASEIADRVDESARRTENTLKAIISALVILLGVVALMYTITQRQLRRERQVGQEREVDLRSVDAALSLLDEQTRDAVRGKMTELRKSGKVEEDRSDDYMR